MIREIGSEFELSAWGAAAGNINRYFQFGDACFTFSGRTAIEHVLGDIEGCHKAMLPSYCCDSMIEPFRRKGIPIGFYQVRYEDGLSIGYSEIPEDCDLLLVCNYFGFSAPPIPAEVVNLICRNKGVIIEDVTHSLLSDQLYHEGCDYVVASLRKWFPLLSGGLSVKLNGAFKDRPAVETDDRFVALKHEAMQKKKAYVDAGYSGNKEEFLTLYGKANEWLRDHYSGRVMDEQSLEILDALDMEDIKAIRKRNAEAIYRGLKACDGIRFLFDVDQMACPLFVPVVAPREVRDRLKQALIRASIYCPVHWPKPEGDCQSNLYDAELSLICDQRYDEADMQRMVQVIKNALACE